MTQQIAVRLPDDLIEFLDEMVASGAASSRAAAVKRAIERERRRLADEADALVLMRKEPHDLDGLAAYVAGQTFEPLD